MTGEKALITILKHMIIIATIFSVLLLLISCAPSLMVPIARPAEIDLRGLNKIAIADIRGKGSREIEGALTSALFESGKFEVLERRNLDRLMKEHRLAFTGVIDEQTAVKLGKLVGAAALVFGDVTLYKVDKNTTYSHWKDREGTRHTTYTRMATGKVNVSFKVVGLRTGKIIAAKTISKRVEKETSATDAMPEPPDPDEVLDMARNSVVTQFIHMISPYQDYVSVKFETNSKLPELNEGVAYARTGDWDLAEKKFRQAVDKMLTSPEAHYDLGVACEYKYKFREAEKELRKAIRLSTLRASSSRLAGLTASLTKPTEKYSREIEHVKRLKKERQKLKEQGIIK